MTCKCGQRVGDGERGGLLREDLAPAPERAEVRRATGSFHRGCGLNYIGRCDVRITRGPVITPFVVANQASWPPLRKSRTRRTRACRSRSGRTRTRSIIGIQIKYPPQAQSSTAIHSDTCRQSVTVAAAVQSGHVLAAAFGPFGARAARWCFAASIRSVVPWWAV
jgi:hypothetical protein